VDPVTGDGCGDDWLCAEELFDLSLTWDLDPQVSRRF